MERLSIEKRINGEWFTVMQFKPDMPKASAQKIFNLLLSMLSNPDSYILSELND
jgi:hypothetical protein